MTAKLIEIFVLEGIAVLMFIFSYLIGVKGKLELIAGYNEKTASKVKDKNGLKRLIARLCLLLGIGSALMPLLTYSASNYTYGMAYAIGGYGGFIIGIIGMVVLQANDYTV